MTPEQEQLITAQARYKIIGEFMTRCRDNKLWEEDGALVAETEFEHIKALALPERRSWIERGNNVKGRMK